MTVEKLKTAVANINAYLSETHDDDDTVTLTVNVIRSVMENYEELIKYKESVSLTDNEVIEAFEVKVNLIGSMTSVYLDENEGQALYDAMDDARLLIKRQKANAVGLTNAVNFLNEQLSSAKAGTVEKTRALFQAMVNKFMSIKDLYVNVDGEYLPWEPSEEVEHLFGMSIIGDNDEIDKETDRVIKELVGEDNG